MVVHFVKKLVSVTSCSECDLHVVSVTSCSERDLDVVSVIFM